MELINENMARAAKEVNSFDEYVEGSATERYNQQCARVHSAAEECKKRIPAERHEEIDRLVERYCAKLAKWTNDNNANEARCPSIMVCGGGNFPVAKKNKQNARRDSLMREYNEIEKIFDKINNYALGGFPILSSDADAVEKLKAQIADAERKQEEMKIRNAYYRKNKTLKGCEGVSDELAAKLDAIIPTTWYKTPHAPFELTNNNANIKRLRGRVAEIERMKTTAAGAWDTEGLNLEIIENKEIMRLQVIFDTKPDADTRDLLKSAAFKWSPSQNAWQRQLTDNARYALKKILSKLKEATKK